MYVTDLFELLCLLILWTYSSQGYLRAYIGRNNQVTGMLYFYQSGTLQNNIKVCNTQSGRGVVNALCDSCLYRSVYRSVAIVSYVIPGSVLPLVCSYSG